MGLTISRSRSRRNGFSLPLFYLEKISDGRRLFHRILTIERHAMITLGIDQSFRCGDRKRHLKKFSQEPVGPQVPMVEKKNLSLYRKQIPVDRHTPL